MTYRTAIDPDTINGEAQSQWSIERLDLDAYLERLDYTGGLDPTVETLHALHRAHMASIPFENLDILLGRGISLELGDIQEKIVRERRGGYCFEQNLLFAAALERLGFRVTRLAARVAPDRPGPRTHVCLLIEAGEEPWLADVGFGTTLLEPILVQDGTVARQGDWTYGISREDGLWFLRSQNDGQWANEYAFTVEPQHPIDYVVGNHYTSTHPNSPFARQIVALRKTDDTQYALRSRNLIITRPGQHEEVRAIARDELGEVLEGIFGIHLTNDDISTLIDSF